ncbi:translation initiation factor IF-2-like [Sphaerodactylus townsendi]|uniref:translation initiation factor IF-2-like n=1 Tax=Sphaerodactylus townsendi TaxID=933632 RepID=UPI002026D74D|nr:translation initiation factor IF-2-like [Sphaerodactylus townsendi]
MILHCPPSTGDKQEGQPTEAQSPQPPSPPRSRARDCPDWSSHMRRVRRGTEDRSEKAGRQQLRAQAQSCPLQHGREGGYAAGGGAPQESTEEGPETKHTGRFPCGRPSPAPGHSGTAPLSPLLPPAGWASRAAAFIRLWFGPKPRPAAGSWQHQTPEGAGRGEGGFWASRLAGPGLLPAHTWGAAGPAGSKQPPQMLNVARRKQRRFPSSCLEDTAEEAQPAQPRRRLPKARPEPLRQPARAWAVGASAQEGWRNPPFSGRGSPRGREGGSSAFRGAQDRRSPSAPSPRHRPWSGRAGAGSSCGCRFPSLPAPPPMAHAKKEPPHPLAAGGNPPGAGGAAVPRIPAPVLAREAAGGGPTGCSPWAGGGACGQAQTSAQSSPGPREGLACHAEAEHSRGYPCATGPAVAGAPLQAWGQNYPKTA